MIMKAIAKQGKEEIDNLSLIQLLDDIALDLEDFIKANANKKINELF